MYKLSPDLTRRSRGGAFRTVAAWAPSGRYGTLRIVAPDQDRTCELSFVRELPMTRAAIEFARERHGEQRRDGDGAPFLLHPLEVASLLERYEYPDYVVAAAVLHDVLEDTDAVPAELRARFGKEVCELVAVVSDDAAIADEEERKDSVRERVRAAGGYAPVVYAADKVSRVRELPMLLAAGLDVRTAATKLVRYRKSLAMLEQTIPASRVVELLRLELEALEQLPPAPSPAPTRSTGEAR